jgi:outer membrane murein-binding lipoprotein Lpp
VTIELLGHLDKQEAAMTVRFTLVTAFVSTLVLGSVIRGSDLIAAQAAPQNPSAQSPANMQNMMKMHEQVMAEMKAGNAKLDALVKDMNAARGDAKINAVAAVVNELVGQHKAMYERMGQMHEQMMGGRGMMIRR